MPVCSQGKRGKDAPNNSGEDYKKGDDFSFRIFPEVDDEDGMRFTVRCLCPSCVQLVSPHVPELLLYWCGSIAGRRSKLVGTPTFSLI